MDDKPMTLPQAKSLLDKLRAVEEAREKERPVVKWGRERRGMIVKTMMHPRHFTTTRYDVLRFTRRDQGAVSMAHFFDYVATEETMKQVEAMLGIHHKEGPSE